MKKLLFGNQLSAIRSVHKEMARTSNMVSHKTMPNTADIIIEVDNRIILIRRGNPPFQNMLALPGGFVDFGERVEDAAIREAYEELNCDVQPIEILGVYSGEERDPRGPVVTTVFICQTNDTPVAGDDAKSIEWIDIQRIGDYEYAFDHFDILQDYIKWKQDRTTFWSSKT